LDFSPFAASFFAPHLYGGSARSALGCGATALAMLTGELPERISLQNRKAHFSDGFMLRFLRARGFRTLRLTPALIVQAKAPIRPDHVLLVSQLFQRGEGTWGIVFGGMYYHNCETYHLSTFSFMNKLILSAFLVLHPKWRVGFAAKVERPKPVPKGLRLTIDGLRKHAKFSWLRTWT
jgi:hypothetical protein